MSKSTQDFDNKQFIKMFQMIEEVDKRLSCIISTANKLHKNKEDLKVAKEHLTALRRKYAILSCKKEKIRKRSKHSKH